MAFPNRCNVITTNLCYERRIYLNNSKKAFQGADFLDDNYKPFNSGHIFSARQYQKNDIQVICHNVVLIVSGGYSAHIFLSILCLFHSKPEHIPLKRARIYLKTNLLILYFIGGAEKRQVWNRAQEDYSELGASSKDSIEQQFQRNSFTVP